MADDTRAVTRSPLLIPAAVLAVGIALAALIFGAFFYNARTTDATIQVVGSASQRFTSDTAKWRLTLSRRVGLTNLSAGYNQLNRDLRIVLDRLQEAGIDSSAVTIQPVNANQIWGPQGLQEGYNLVQSLIVISDNPAELERLAINPGQLLESGVVIEGSYLEYFYSRIAELKHELLSQATADARQRAQEIVGESGGRLNRMITGRAGVFQITEPFSTEVSGMGMYSTSTRDKEISVTVHATFEAD